MANSEWRMGGEGTRGVFARLLIVLFSLFAIRNSLFAAGTSTASFLKIGVGARAAAMGEAFTAVSDNATALDWNPAGLSLVKWREAHLSHQVWIENTRISHAAYAHPALGGTLAAGIARVGPGELEGRDEFDRVTGSFEVVDQSVSIGYGRRFGSRFSAGTALRVIHQKIDDESGTGFSGNLGVLVDFPLEDQTVRWGAAIKEIGPQSGPGIKSDLPTSLHLGVSDRLFNESLILSAEGVVSGDDPVRVGIGTEVFLGGFFSIRGGYRFRQDDVTGLGGITAGFGAVLSAGWDYVIDYAYAGQGDLGLTHRLSLSLRF